MSCLVINSGSSSLKISLFDEQLKELEAFKTLEDVKVVPKIIGHRIVHGGPIFTKPTLITPQVEKKLRDFTELAPLHIPPSLEKIDMARKKFPNVPQYAVFDTAFHATIPDKASLYPIPLDLAQRLRIKRYGFHGISHAYLTSCYPNREAKLITLHLGSGCSIAAIQAGKSLDTSMGFTPLDGLMMATRSGELDPAIVIFLREKGEDCETLLNKESGLLGISGSSDMKKLTTSNEPKALLAIDMFVYRIVKYIGAYKAVLKGIDALIFSGGIGENSSLIRQKILESLELPFDEEANRANQKILSNTPFDILVIPTNENLQIARELKSFYN